MSDPRPNAPGECCNDELAQPTHNNPPGQPALAYRVGSHATFLRRLLARLPTKVVAAGAGQPLADLTTRAAEDPAIALLDAYAMMADVLSFYQERIANEGYVRTATERRSVLELARAIGYELNPGVAASAYLAFTVEDAPGAPGQATIPVGTRVQSIPAQGQRPQTFETAEEITARAGLNALRPRQTRPQLLGIAKDAQGATHLAVLGADEQWQLARAVYIKGVVTTIKAGDLLLAAHVSRPHQQGFLGVTIPVRRLVIEASQQRTRIELDIPENQDLPPPTSLSLLDEQQSPYEGLFAFRTRVGFFGHNASRWESLPKPDSSNGSPYAKSWDDKGQPSTIWLNSQGELNYRTTNFDVHLERIVPDILAATWALFVTADIPPGPRCYRIQAASEVSLADYAMSGRVTGLRLRLADGEYLPQLDAGSTPKFSVRATTAHVQSERLELAELPIEGAIGKGATLLALERMVAGLSIGQTIIIGGELNDQRGEFGVEHKTIIGIDQEGYTTLRLDQGLSNSYVRASLTINANVARATHGETVVEPLGSGDGAQANQRFTLRRPPLTYVAAPTASGARSTLELRVNGVLWSEAPSLYGLDARAQAYTIRHDDDGKASVIFGDGRQGARLPSGQENVVATYRSGIGLDGAVGAGSLTLLQTRPLGVRGVTNPLPASGGAGPERLEGARVSAPQTVQTLDRIVSLRDFEQFARGFAGIGKAQAVVLDAGPRRLVHITVAAADGGPVAPELKDNLRKAIDQARDPAQSVLVASFLPGFFRVAARVWIDPRSLAADVLAAARNALLDVFGFAKRAFGQPVSVAEVLATLQHVPGVVAVDLDKLHRDPIRASFAPPSDLPASLAHWHNLRPNDATPMPAELLLINPGSGGIKLTEMAL